MANPTRIKVEPHEKVTVVAAGLNPGERFLVSCVVFSDASCGTVVAVVPFTPTGCAIYLGVNANQKSTANPLTFDEPGVYEFSPDGVVAPKAMIYETARWSTEPRFA